MKRSADELQKIAAERGLVAWPIHECTFCHYKVGYVFREDGVFFDTGCWCVRTPDKLRRESWEDVARHYNMQDDARYIASMDEFWASAATAQAATAREVG